ncbi:hypothetical protein K7X08_001763 [Anisodus acutangulus]|uniref:Uncharacterized protein n=1 Tax=Anisodus acutangulus TaxID=402998 RepID=A0A9Q1LN49_9SOLA|nr:hypothetical protein K7X08_001763 [Anisodus acutangulus]
MGRPLALTSPPCPSTHIPPGFSWVVPVFAVAVLTGIHGWLTLRLIGKKRRRFVIELMFVANLAIESGVAMRCQFNHDFNIVKVNCVLTTISAILALGCMFWDTYERYKNVVPMQRIRYLYRHVCHWGILIQLVQVAIRLVETVVRFRSRRDGSSIIPVYVLESDFSLVPLALAIATWSVRMAAIEQNLVNSVNVMVIGGVNEEQRPQQVANLFPNPSPFINALLRLNPLNNNNNNHPAFSLKSFDLWSTIVATNNRGDITLNMWDMRHSLDIAETNWSIPSVDFILLRFSLANRDSYGIVRALWIPLLRGHAPGVRIILIGTDRAQRNGYMENNPTNAPFVTYAEGKELALWTKAVYYEECDCPNDDHQRRLVTKLVKLMT